MPSESSIFNPHKYDDNLDREKLYVITVNLPGYYLNFLHKLLIARRYPSRSEIIRIATREFVHKEVEMNRRIDAIEVEDLIEKINGHGKAVCIHNGGNNVEMHKIIKRLV